MADGDYDKLIKYISGRWAAYLDTPAEERRANRRSRLERRESWRYRWFGLIPYAVVQWVRSVIKN